MNEAMVKGIIIVALAAVLFLAGGFAGYSWCKRNYDAGIIKQQKKDAEVVFKHEVKKEKVIEYVDKVVTKIKFIKDTSGCLDVPSGDDYLNELLKSDSKTQSSFN